MSWFETVKNIAKTVAENAATVVSRSMDSRHVLGGASAASAIPTNRSGYWSVLSRSGTSGNSPNDSSESDSDSGTHEASGSTSASQVTTRARFSYELDRFQKNALLMFVQMNSQPPANGREGRTTNQDMNELTDTFMGFRFEVTTYVDLTCMEIESKCQQFFQQNFDQYGAVMVVVLSFDGITGHLSALDGQFSESIISRHLTDELNATLLGKPKIYITEANRTVSPENGSRLSISLDGYQDVLALHLPTIHHSVNRRPLKLLCDNIKNMADTHDLAAILQKFIEEASSTFQDVPIEFSNKLTKELILARL